MFVSYLIKIYLLSIVLKCADSVSSHSLLPSHCNYTIETIDAITNFTNGSIFVASGHNYWTLRPHEKPIHSNALRISDFLAEDVIEVEAAVNLKIRADRSNRRCVSVDESLMFYSKTNDSTLIHIYEDQKWTVFDDVSKVDVLSAARTVNWSLPIDAFGFFEDITVIFQGDSYISIRCEQGVWQEVRHLSIPVSFSDIKGPVDSANFIKTHSLLDDAYLYLFKGKDFYICPIYGSDPCSGPLSIVDDFFRFDEECGLNPKYLKSTLWLWLVIFIVVVLTLLFLFVCCFLMVARSRKITFWVNRRRSKERTQGMTYESLNGQTDGNVKGTEMKVQNTNGNQLETNLDEPTNTPFIDSNGKDDH